MTFRPIAPLPAPAKATATEPEATSASGDFAALLALMAGVMPAPVPAQDPACGTTDPSSPGEPPAAPTCPLPAATTPVPATIPPGEPPLPTVADPVVSLTVPGPGTPPQPDAPIATVVPAAPPRKAPSAVPSPTPPSPAPPRTSRHEPSAGPRDKSEIHTDEAILSPTGLDPAVALDRPKPDIRLPEKAAGLPAPNAAAAHANVTAPLAAPPRAEAAVAPDAPPPARIAPPPVSEQIVSAVVPLHGRGDGRHEVTLELRPEDLGTIRVEVSVEHQTVHLTLHAAEPATSRLLSAALPDLRSALADAGLTAGHVGVGGHGGGDAGARRPSTETEAPANRPTRPATTEGDDGTAPVRTLRPAAAGRLDLFL